MLTLGVESQRLRDLERRRTTERLSLSGAPSLAYGADMALAALMWGSNGAITTEALSWRELDALVTALALLYPHEANGARARPAWVAALLCKLSRPLELVEAERIRLEMTRAGECVEVVS